MFDNQPHFYDNTHEEFELLSAISKAFIIGLLMLQLL
jgi:hypothetical protein